MALLADGVAQRRLQPGGIHDAELGLSLAGHVQFAWAVAALAANRVFPRQRLVIVVYRVRHGAGVVGMAIQALHLNRAIEEHVRGVARRNVPSFLLRVPTDRRLVEVAVPTDDVAAAVRTGAHDE